MQLVMVLVYNIWYGANLTKVPPSAPVGGASTNTVFFENDNSVDVSYTISSGKNAMVAGPDSNKIWRHSHCTIR